MPLLGALLVSLFAGLAEFFAKFLTRKVAVAGAAITLFLGLTTALFVGIGAMISALAVAIPGDTMFATGLWLAIPDNGPGVFAACVAADALIAVYRINVTNIMVGVSAS
jgi:hypothetical protein